MKTSSSVASLQLPVIRPVRRNSTLDFASKAAKVAAILVSLVGVLAFSAEMRAQEAKPQGRPQLVLKFRPDSVYCLAWSPDGTTLATGADFGVIRLWDARSGTFRSAMGQVNDFSITIETLAFSPDGKLLASGDDQKELKIWNAATGTLVRTFKREDSEVAHENTILDVAWSPDGKTLASASKDMTVALWDVATGTRSYTLRGHTEEVTGIAFSPDGTTLSSVGEDMKLWDARTGAPKGGYEPKFTGFEDVAWSPDGTTLAIASSPLTLWDVRTQKVKNAGAIPVTPFLGEIRSVAWSPDGKSVATGHGFPSIDRVEGDVLIWDAATSTIKKTLRGHKSQVDGVAFSPDGKSLASVSGARDGSLKIWPLAGNRPPVTLLPLADERDNPRNWIAMTEEGFYNTSDSPEIEKALKWRVGKEELPLQTYAATFRRPDIVSRLIQPQPIAANSEIGLLLASRSAPPAVSFLTPEDKTKVKGDSLTVQVVASDETAVRRLDFRVNGRPVTVPFSVAEPQDITDANRSTILGGKAVPASHTTAMRYNATVPLPPGESKVLVRAIARDSSGLEGSADINVERELTNARGMVLTALTGAAALEAQRSLQGNLHVLSVGVSRYKNATYNLQYPVADATSFAALWPPMKDRLYQKVLVTQLADDNATAPAIQTALNELIKVTTNRDTVVIFLAGHGLKTSDQNFYFASHEVDFKNPEKTALPWTSFTDVLAKVPAKRVVLFLDACHSGAALGDARASNERMAETMVKRAGVMVFASSRGDQASLESAEWGHGAFTKAVLEGIEDGKANLDSGAGQDGNITVAKLLVYLQARVPKLTGDQQSPACPLMQDFGEPFRLAKMANAN